MKKMAFKLKRAYYSIPILTAAAATCATSQTLFAASNTVDQVINGGSTELDLTANWSLGTLPTTSNDVLFASPYPVSTANTTFSLGASTNTAGGTVSWGTLNDTAPVSGYDYIEGSTANNSSFTLNIGYGSNSIAPSSGDLLYVGTGAVLDFLSSNKSYGAMAVNFNQSGNIDIAGTGVLYSNSAVNGSTGTVLTKTGTGVLDLINANQTFKGTWNLAAGTMDIEGGGGLGVAPTGVPELTFTGSSTLQFLTGANGVGSSRIIAINAGVTGTFDTNGYNVSVGGPIVAGINGSGGTLNKVGSGTLTLSGNFNYAQSSLTVSAGTLSLGVNANLSSPTLVLGSYASYILASGYNFNQSFTSVTLSPGASNISSTAFNNSSLSLNLGTLSRSTGAVVDISGVASGSLGTVTTLTPNSSFSGGPATIIGGYATYGGQTTFAVSAASGTTPGAVTGLTTFDNTFNVTGADVDVNGSSNLSPTITSVNSVRFNDSGNSYSITIAPTSTLSIASGGILETANVGSNFDLFTGGNLTSGNGADLIVTDANTSAFMDFYSTIVDAPSGPIALATSGAGAIFLFNANTFSGPTYASTSGKLELENQFALQNSTLAGGTVIFVGGVGSFSIGGIGTSSNISLIDSNSNPVALTIGGNNQNTTFNGIFTGTGGSVTKIGTGLTFLANANSTFTGGLTIASGGIEFTSGAAFGLSNTSITNLVTIDNGAYIQYIAAGVSNFGSARGFILGGGNDTIQVGSTTNTSTSSLTIGASNNTGGVLAGPNSGTSTLVKTGNGTLIVNTASTYNGGTNVTGGTLVAYRSGSLGTYSIASNPSYTGNGPLNIVPASTLSATVDLEAVAPQISSLSNYIGSNASGGTANLVLGFPAINSSTTVSIGADNTSTLFSGNIGDLSANYSGTVGSLIKVGTGILTLSGNNTYAGTTNVSAGTLALASLTALPASSNLTIAAGATVFAANASTGVFALSLSTLINSGLLDLGKNGAVIRTGSTLASISSQISQNFNGGAWNGTTGITSSAAAADPKHLTALGTIINDNGAGTGTALYGAFEGANTTDGDILVKYTYYGDANLDGKVDGSDYSRIDASFVAEKNSGTKVTGWFNGDFNYDNFVDGSDYTLIDNAFNSQSTVYASEIASPLATATAQIAAVPEPATLSLIALGTVGVLGSRRRRHSTGLTRAH